MGHYDGKRIVITGGTSGIGLATAKLLTERGARVLVTGRGKASLDAARDALGKSARAVASDATYMTDIEALATVVKAEVKGLDLLFANAGFGRFVPPRA